MRAPVAPRHLLRLSSLNANALLLLTGLLYEDIMIETTDVKLALSRLPKDVIMAREQRLKRAMVLSSQQRYLPDEVAEKIDPWQPYLSPYLQAIEEQKNEEKLLAK